MSNNRPKYGRVAGTIIASGVAALTAAHPANANVYLYNVGQNISAGGEFYSPTSPISYTLEGLPSAAQARFYFSYPGSGGIHLKVNGVGPHSQPQSEMRFTGVLAPGAVFQPPGAAVRVLGTATAASGYGGTHKTPTGDNYYGFRFEDSNRANATDYGWIEIGDGTANVLAGGDAYGALIERYAYDNTGALLPAGQTTPVPEAPTELALAAFGAMSLGAEGIRRLKAAAARNSA